MNSTNKPVARSVGIGGSEQCPNGGARAARLSRLIRWCARWAGGVLLCANAVCQPPPLAAQAPPAPLPPQYVRVLVHWGPFQRTDSVVVDVATLARVDVWVVRDSVTAMTGCVLAKLRDGSAALFPIAVRVIGDTTFSSFIGPIPVCAAAFATYSP